MNRLELKTSLRVSLRECGGGWGQFPNSTSLFANYNGEIVISDLIRVGGDETERSTDLWYELQVLFREFTIFVLVRVHAVQERVRRATPRRSRGR